MKKSEACSYQGLESGQYSTVSIGDGDRLFNNDIYAEKETCFKIVCNLNKSSLNAGDNLLVTVAANGGRNSVHDFSETNYENNEVSGNLKITETNNEETSLGCDSSCGRTNNWTVNFAFKYSGDGEIISYPTGVTAYTKMVYQFISAGGSAVTVDTASGTDNYNASLGSRKSYGYNLFYPNDGDYIAYASNSWTEWTTKLCSDYHDGQCWRYENYPYGMFVYYLKSSAVTNVYTSMKTLTTFTSRCTSGGVSTRSDFGSLYGGNVGGGLGYQNAGANGYVGCHGGNSKGTVCSSVTDWWGNPICESEQANSLPSDYIPDKNFGYDATAVTGTGYDGYTAKGCLVNSETGEESAYSGTNANNIKNDLYKGNAGLQLSINSTSEEQRKDMFSGNALTLNQISDIVKDLPMPVGRKYALNFALADTYEVNAEKLRDLFDPKKCMVKITPLHMTHSCVENNILTSGGYTSFVPYQKAEADLIKMGFNVLVFVPSMDEDGGRITCGNAILSGTMPECKYEFESENNNQA